MTRADKIKRARRKSNPASSSARLPRAQLLLAGASIAGLVAAGVLLWSSSDQKGTVAVFTGAPVTDPGPIHVHGLGINPSDGSLFIATHTGLFRVGADSRTAVRVGDRYQDTMGFSIVGPNRFLGSGHPDAREQNLPPLLGLIESTDAGKTWAPISLLGEADFHVLRSAGTRVYGYDASNGRLLASTDEGQRWRELEQPEGTELVDLAANPEQPHRLVATAVGGFEQGTYASDNGGRDWEHLNDAAGLLAWPVASSLYLVDDQGKVLASNNGGRSWTTRGEIGGRPAALVAVGEDEAYVALHDGTIKRSTDGGAVWTIRSRP